MSPSILSNYVTGLLVAIMIAMATPNLCMAATDERAKNEAEAATFFNQVLRETDNPLIASMARSSLSQLGQPGPRRHHAEVTLYQQLNRVLAVPTVVNGKVIATMALDTGASYTVITPELARQLGITVDATTPTIPLLTGNGVVRAPVVSLKRLKFGTVELRDVKAVIRDLGPNSAVSGLMGMNCFKDKEITLSRNRLIVDYVE